MACGIAARGMFLLSVAALFLLLVALRLLSHEASRYMSPPVHCWDGKGMTGASKAYYHSGAARQP
jgi:hypothetical protein